MAQEYTIKAVGSKINDWDSAYGAMKTYLVQLEGNGEPVQINKKASSDPPKAGDTIYGDIEQTQWGQKFKTALKPMGGSASTPKSSGYQESPEKQTSIYRSVALNNASVIYHGSGEKASVIFDLADAMVEWLEKTPPASSTESISETKDTKFNFGKEEKIVPVDDFGNEEIDLSTVPF